jgi:hypothetical protein
VTDWEYESRAAAEWLRRKRRVNGDDGGFAHAKCSEIETKGAVTMASVNGAAGAAGPVPRR